MKFLLSQTMIIDQLRGRGWGLIFFYCSSGRMSKIGRISKIIKVNNISKKSQKVAKSSVLHTSLKNIKTIIEGCYVGS